MRDFPELLRIFAKTVETADHAAFVDLFQPDGVYEDALWGVHAGREAIAGLLKRFHEKGRSFHWEFFDPVCDGQTGYARYCFSCLIRSAVGMEQPVIFEGVSQFRFKDGLIAYYDELFDRGVIMTQLGTAAEPLKRALDDVAATRNAQQPCKAHVERLGVL